MKTLLALLLTCFTYVLFGQAPPIQRNDFTTNNNPTARGVVTQIVNGASQNVSNAISSGSSSVNLSLPNYVKTLNNGTGTLWGVFGDSTAFSSVQYVFPSIYNSIGTNGVNFGSGTHIAGAATNVQSATSTQWMSSIYALHTNASQGAGRYATTNADGAFTGATYGDTFQVFGQFSSDGGSLTHRIRTNGGAFTVYKIYNLSNTYGAFFTNWSDAVNLPLGYYQSELVYSNGGISYIFNNDVYDSTGRGLRVLSFSQGEASIGTITNLSPIVVNNILSNLGVSLASFEWRDFSNETAIGLPVLQQVLTNGLSKADKLFIGGAPAAANDSEYIGAAFAIRGFSLSNKYAFVNMRDQSVMSSYATMTNSLQTTDDGIHPSDKANRVDGSYLLHVLPFVNNNVISPNYVAGTPAIGRQYFDRRGSTNDLVGALGVYGVGYFDAGLRVNGAVIAGGPSGSLVLPDRASPLDTGLYWQQYNINQALTFYQNADVFQMVNAGGRLYFGGTPGLSEVVQLTNWARAFLNGTVGGTALPIFHAGTNLVNGLTVSTNGNVGIGTNAPAQALEVQGNVNVSGHQTNNGGFVSGANNGGFYHPSSGSFINANSAVSGTFSILNKSTLTSAADGQFTIANNGGNNFTRLNFGGATAAFPALGRTNGNLVVFGGNGLFAGGNTNNFWLQGGALIQDFSVSAPGAPDRQGALYWNDGTNACVVLRNGAGTLTTNKLSMTSWP